MEPLDGLEKRPGMYLSGNYEQTVSYLLGLDNGTGVLAGFQELVELKLGEESSVAWSALIPKINPPIPESGPDEERRARLFELLREFVCLDGGMHGRRRIFQEWVLMIQATRNYDPALIRYSQSPAPLAISVDEAAELLGTDRTGILSLAKDHKIRHGRVGGQVLIVADAVNKLLERRAEPAENLPRVGPADEYDALLIETKAIIDEADPEGLLALGAPPTSTRR